jgi:hypothetical protein
MHAPKRAGSDAAHDHPRWQYPEQCANDDDDDDRRDVHTLLRLRQ